MQVFRRSRAAVLKLMKYMEESTGGVCCAFLFNILLMLVKNNLLMINILFSVNGRIFKDFLKRVLIMMHFLGKLEAEIK